MSFNWDSDSKSASYSTLAVVVFFENQIACLCNSCCKNHACTLWLCLLLCILLCFSPHCKITNCNYPTTSVLQKCTLRITNCSLFSQEYGIVIIKGFEYLISKEAGLSNDDHYEVAKCDSPQPNRLAEGLHADRSLRVGKLEARYGEHHLSGRYQHIHWHLQEEGHRVGRVYFDPCHGVLM